jgi:hypothetical protein
MNKSELEAKRWLVRNKGLREDEIVKSKGTPDFLTPIGGFEVKKLYGDKIIFYSDQMEELARFPEARILVFRDNGELVKEALFSEIDLGRGTLGDLQVVQTDMLTIQVTKSTAKQLQGLAGWGETYDTVIRRLLNGAKGEPHGDTKHEPTGNSGNKS